MIFINNSYELHHEIIQILFYYILYNLTAHCHFSMCLVLVCFTPAGKCASKRRQLLYYLWKRNRRTKGSCKELSLLLMTFETWSTGYVLWCKATLVNKDHVNIDSYACACLRLPIIIILCQMNVMLIKHSSTN